MSVVFRCLTCGELMERIWLYVFPVRFQYTCRVCGRIVVEEVQEKVEVVYK